MQKLRRYGIWAPLSGCLFLLLSLFSYSLFGQSHTVAFSSSRWNKERARVEQHLGREALAGSAYLNGDVTTENGVIEVDIALSGARSYPGIVFRRKDARNFERIYLRPHRAGFYPDAIQYTPTFNGIEAWQLFNGAGYTAAREFPHDEWIHLRLEFSGRQARLFVGADPAPALHVSDLQHDAFAGALGVAGPPDGSAWFSNFSYREDSTLSFPAIEKNHPFPGTITRWELSRPFRSGDVDFERTPDAQGLTDLQWSHVQARPSGLVNIAEYHGRQGRESDCVWARSIIDANAAERRKLQIGYSDAVAVFLNGEPVFSGSNAYRQRDPSSLGIIGYHDEVYLPLRQGANELLLCVVESFGGWGFKARNGDAEWHDARLHQSWNLGQKLRLPESVVHDEDRDRLYVSNFFNEGKEFISIISTDGRILEKEWITGLRQPTGLALHDDVLYIVDRTGVHAHDAESGDELYVAKTAGTMFLNDICVDEDGIGYVSDSRASRIYRLRDGAMTLWLEREDIRNPNGLAVRDGILYVGSSGDAQIKAVSIDEKNVRTVCRLKSGAVIDGLVCLPEERLLASDHAGCLFLIEANGGVVPLLDRRTTGEFCADFAWIEDAGLVVIPSLMANSLSAFEFQLPNE